LRGSDELHPERWRSADPAHRKDRLGRKWEMAFYLVKEVIAYLTQIWGPADMMTAYPPPGGGPLAGKQGAILFEVKGWGDAQGHASLWNGKTCYDHCYFNEPQSTYKCTNAHFWALP
jgi:hypothetical protein